MPGPAGLRSPEGRLRLLLELRKRGFRVRMHAYEYLVADESGFAAIILLEPWAGRAELLELKEGAADEVAGAVTSVDPSIRVVVDRRIFEQDLRPG